MSSQAVDDFVYPHQLNYRNIRLIRIQLGSLSDQIRISLVEGNLDNNITPFVAISYVWGDASDTQMVICDGCSLKITRSLYAVLWQLRQDKREELFWADAVCINQQDVSEKTRQVRMMFDIYAKAKLVFIWLGEQLESDVIGVTLMESICNLIDETSSPGAAAPLNLTALGLTEVSADTWKAMLAILNRSWFTRAWVVQEYVQAENVVFFCGALLIPHEALLGSARRLSYFLDLRILVKSVTSSDQINLPFGSFFDFAHVFPKEHSLMKLFALSSGLNSTDRRDRLFALIGMASDGKSDLISYDRDYEDVLRDLAIERFRVGVTNVDPGYVFEYLCMVHTHELEATRSSWAPAFEYPIFFQTLGSIFVSSNHIEALPRLEFLARPSMKHLRIEGELVDTVKEILEDRIMTKVATMDDDDGFGIGLPKQWRQILAYCAKVRTLVYQLTAYPTAESLYEVLWRSMIFDTESKHVRASEAMLQCFEAYTEFYALLVVLADHKTGMYSDLSPEEILRTLQQLSPNIKWRPDLSTTGPNIWDTLCRRVGEVEADATKFSNAFGSFSWERRYFVSDLGYVGWVPRHAKVGDKICAFTGSRFPFVIRPYEDGYRLIGACYIHGIMEGEACELPALDDSANPMITLI